MKLAEDVLEYPDGSCFSRGGAADNHDAVTGREGLIDVVNILHEVLTPVEVAPFQPLFDHVKDVVFAFQLGDWDGGKDV